MKNKVPKESVFKKKGFYAALYSCLGVVMVFGAVVSFNNLTANNSKPPIQTEVADAVDFGELEATSKSTAKGITKSKSPETEGDTKTQEKAPEATDAKSSSTSESKSTPAPAPAPTTEPKASSGVKTSESKTPVTPAAPEKKPAESKQTSDASAENEATSADAQTTEAVSEPVFNAFTEDTKMIWPVLGSVVMDFSADHAIYDKTLDQFRTNDNICIAADVGTQVCSSAEGVVKSISHSRENGNTIVIDNGNGWTTTYSQLQDNILVAEGDVVREGQVIGGVASPSIYSVLLGNHVEFKVMKDDELINPVSILE